MATATQVTIKVVVDGSQAGPAIDQINTSLGEIGVKGTASLGKAGAAADKLGGHVATGLDSVRLLSQEFGLRLPRAIEAMLSRMPAVTGMISNMLGAMAGIVALQVFERLAEGAYHLYEKWISLNAVQDEFYEAVKKNADAEFINTRSIEDTTLRIDQATQAMVQFKSLAEQVHSHGIRDILQNLHDPSMGFAQLFESHQLAAAGTASGMQMVQLTPKQIEQQHELNLLGIEARHSADGALGAQQKISAELEKQKQIHAETRSFNKKMDISMGNPVAANAGSAEEDAQNAIARGKYSEQVIALYRKERDERIEAQNAAVLSGLEGDAKFAAEKEAAIAKIQQRYRDGQISQRTEDALTAAMAEKLDNEHADRIQKQTDTERKALRDAQAQGLTGAARIYAEHDSRVQDINSDRELANNPAAAALARQAAQADMNNKLKTLQDNFGDYTKQQDATRVASSIGAEEKISAARQNEIDAVQKKYDDAFVDQTGRDTATIAQHQQLTDALAAIDQAAEGQRAELHARNAQQDADYDKQAADAERRVKGEGLLSWVTDYRNAMAAITAQRQAQMTKLDEDQKKDSLSQAEVEQRRVDIDRTANAQIAAQSQQMQHEIANDLQRAFTNPIDFIKSKMQQMMMDIIANWLMQTKLFQSLYGQTLGSMKPGAAGGAAAAQGGGGILGTIGAAVHSTFPGHPAASAQSSGSGSQTIPGSGGMIMTAAGPQPTFDPGSPALQSHFVGNSSSSAASTAASTAQTVATDIPGLYRRIHPATANPGADASDASAITSMASGDAAATGGAATAQDVDWSGVGAPNILNGLPNGAGVDSTKPNISNGLPGMGGIDPASNGSSGAGGSGSTGGAAAAQKGLGIAAAGMAGYEGYQDTKAAYESGSIGGTMKGMLGDAMAGATIGMMFGGPVGAVIGAGVGALVGLTAGVAGMIMGEGGRLKARDYYKQTLFPQIEAERNGMGSSDYQTAISNVNRTASDGMIYMAEHWGAGAAQWVDDNYLKKEQQLADAQIEERAKGGSYAVNMSAAQFHSGGRITGFGSFGTSSDEGFIHARLNEAVMNPGAVSMHGSAIDAMNSGASPADIARMYLAQSGNSGASAGGGGGDTHHHWSINAMDAKSFDHYLRNGGARQIVKHTNNYATQYAGDGISG